MLFIVNELLSLCRIKVWGMRVPITIYRKGNEILVTNNALRCEFFVKIAECLV